MKTPSNPDAAPLVFNDIPLADRQALVDRIAASQVFQKSARLREFLVYVARCSFENRPEGATEHQIGVQVFGRPEDYHAGDDTIVRSQARLLRQKLEAYFSAEGRAEPLILTIPKGGYLPVISPREAASAAAPAEPGRSPWIPILAVVALLAAGAALWLALRPAQLAPPPAIRSLWSRLLDPALPTTLILPDSVYALQQELAKEQGNLADYLRKRWPEGDANRQLERVAPNFNIRRYTTTDAVAAALKLSDLGHAFGARIQARFAREFALKDLSPGNVVLLGRPTTNPWVETFEPRLNFRFESNLETHQVGCRNTRPQPGEEAFYAPVNTPRDRTVYASAAFLPNLNRRGNVLIVMGTSSGAQESALEFLTNEALFAGFAAKLGRPLPYFEVLLRTVTVDGVSREPAVVTFRRLPD